MGTPAEKRADESKQRGGRASSSQATCSLHVPLGTCLPKTAGHRSSGPFRDHRAATASWKESRLKQLRETRGLKVGS